MLVSSEQEWLAADALPKVATRSSGSEPLDLRFLCLEEEHK